MRLEIAAVCLALLFTFGMWVFKSHMEAKTYNKITSSNVTTWDAMWIELRIIGELD